MPETHILMGSNNAGKLQDAAKVAAQYPMFVLHTPIELGITDEPEETGQTYSENAAIKRSFYATAARQLGRGDFFVITDDSGIEIDALHGEPGIHSRRWKDGETPMTDEEIVRYCLERLQGVPTAKRTAAFAGIMALGHTSRRNVQQDIPYRLEGIILEEADDYHRHPGYPFRALFYLPQYDKLLHDVVELPFEERPEGFLSHREIGLHKAFGAIQSLL